MKRTATSIWTGTGKTGKGKLDTQSGVFQDQPYSAQTRFENEDGKKGTNPEELIGAAHAGCYNMALAFALEKEGIEPRELNTIASVNLKQIEGGFEIDKIHLELRAKVEMEEGKFQEIAKGAKENCPVSKALAGVDISLDAKLESS